jgi:hypothetical protein
MPSDRRAVKPPSRLSSHREAGELNNLADAIHAVGTKPHDSIVDDTR